MIPYGRQFIDQDDIEAVLNVLKSDWLTTGPKVDEFEEKVCEFVGARYAVAVSSGTAALHCAMFAIGIKPGDEVIIPPMTFAATANCVVFQGGKPVIVDVAQDTLLIDPVCIKEIMSPKTRAIIAVDYTGHPCDYDTITDISKSNKIPLVADACHSLGAKYKGKLVGSLADLSVLSFHPVKHITTAEGGMILTDNKEYYERMRLFRNHGIKTDHRQREKQGSWIYEMTELGYNYRITDIQCALGITQLHKLPEFLSKRRAIAKKYDKAFAEIESIQPLFVQNYVQHAYHLYVVRLKKGKSEKDRSQIFREMREKGVGVNVHYIPVHLHPYYRRKFNTVEGLCPVSETAYEEIISLPMHPNLSDDETNRVIDTLIKAGSA